MFYNYYFTRLLYTSSCSLSTVRSRPTIVIYRDRITIISKQNEKKSLTEMGPERINHIRKSLRK